MTGRRGRLSKLEAQRGRAVTLWEALPEHLRADVTPEALERAAQEAPEGLRGDVRAVSLWAFLCVPEGGEA
ncbi:hypothetical protein [Deinococcus knuensis]|uniref:Uncharacterized protein n=1 Tax=Deinococcus knuensis TaxID=1837380 RepID=A0ABQ2SAM9_9DEIO|nr:hypothetical protein [Deinococcus knuensis]GGS14538.1 hypothetical protein GCM10008961_02240 [Deinococcus knuensis]